MSQLETYLTDHLAAARGGMDLFRRAAEHHRGTPRGEALTDLANDVAEDLQQLRDIMAGLDVGENRLLSLAAAAAERVGRLKPNGRLFRRPPLTHLVEVEALRDAVSAKHSGWDALLSAAGSEPRLPEDLLAGLKKRAENQAERLARIHVDLAKEVFGDHR